MDCISDYEGKVGLQGSVSQSVLNELLPRLQINLEAGSVSVRRAADALLNIRDVLVGPFDLQLGVSK